MPRFVTLLSAAALAAPAPAADPARPNVVAVVCDDLADWALGCYGGPDARTPHLDKLAAGGARLTNAFVTTPVCSPSRATYLTGRYGTQLGVTDWISAAEEAAGVGLPAAAVTWPAVLKDAGYATALVGKWHLGRRPEFHPSKHGFGHFYGFLGAYTRAMEPTFDLPEGPVTVRGCSADLVTDDALKFVAAHRDKSFALCVHFREPHEPYGPMPAEDTAPFAGRKLTLPAAKGLDPEQVAGWTREYLAAVHAVDRNVGRLLAELDRLELADRTVVLFTSDHGYNIGHHGVHGKGNARWVAGGVQGPPRPNMWDRSIRVPLIARGPGVGKGVVVGGAVSSVDTFATVLALAGVAPPKGRKQEGVSFAPLLKGGPGKGREVVFGQYDLHHRGSARMRMARTERWKLVRHFEGDMLDELYDLAADPGEEKNLYPTADRAAPLAGAPKDAVADLDAKLRDWMKGIDDPLARKP